MNSALRAHPGSFPFVSLSCGFMKAVDADRTMLARWFRLLAIKGVEELVFVNLATRRAAPTRRALQLRLTPSPVPRRVEVRRHLHTPARCVLPRLQELSSAPSLRRAKTSTSCSLRATFVPITDERMIFRFLWKEE
ncbi:unnamed protein product [Urochloa humidicola]